MSDLPLLNRTVVVTRAAQKGLVLKAMLEKLEALLGRLNQSAAKANEVGGKLG